MKQASKVRLSLRKLFVAMLALGPIAVLPSPVLAAVPTSAPFTVTNGTATWSAAGTSATINSSDRAVLVWNDNAFNIATGETFNFTLPSGGAVLNKVGYNTNGTLAAADDAIIDGTLFSTGRVFVLANGNILVGGGASITTAGGLVLSTLQESSDFSFTTVGNLTFTGASTGGITIGNATNSPSISGGLEAVAGSITSHRASVTGDLILRAVTATGGIDVAQSGAVNVTGNLTVVTNNGAITGTNAVTVGATTTGNQTTTLSTGASGNASITLANAANNFESVAITAPGANGDVTLADADIIRLAASTIGDDLAVTATGGTDTPAVASEGTLTIGGDASFTTSTSNSGVNIANNSTIAGTVSGTLVDAPFSINVTGNLSSGAINVGTGRRNSITLRANGGALTVGGALVATGNDNNAGANISLTGTSVTQTGTITQTANRGANVTYNATAGNVQINGAVTASRVVATSANGTITQTAVITTNPVDANGTNSTAVSSFNAGSGTITLGAANAFFANQPIQLTASTATLENTNATTLGTTNVTGALTVDTNGAALTLGTGAGTDAQHISVGGLLTATTGGGAITDGNYTRFNVFGGLNLTTGAGAVELDAAVENGSLAPRVVFGRVDITSSGTVEVNETTTLNLGTINGPASLVARSTQGGVIDSGTITLAGGGTGTFSAASGDSIVLDNSGHNIPIINVTGGMDNSILLGAAAVLGTGTSVNGNLTLSSTAGVPITLGAAGGTAQVTGNLSVNSGGTITIADVVSVAGNLTLQSADATATSITDTGAGQVGVTGTTTVGSSGGVVLDGANNFGMLVLNNISGPATFSDINDLTVSGNASGVVTVTAGGAGGVAGPWNLTFGNLHVGNLVATAGTGGGGDSGRITQQSGTSLHVFGDSEFTTTDNNIILANNGNSFGRLELTVSSPSASRTVQVVEDGTMKLGNLSSRGSTTLTSRFGSIIEDSAADAVITNNGTLTLNAINGSVLIGNTTHTAGTTTGNLTAVVVNAPTGAVAIQSNDTLSLGSINANSLTVTVSGGGNDITQSTGLRVFGAANFTSTGGNIVLTNATNNFGRVSLTAATPTRNISITEAGTLNIGSVTMGNVGNTTGSTGNFTATSLGGDIIDTGLAGAKFGGFISTTVGTPLVVGSGVVTLSAANGNIILDDPTTEFATSAGVVFNGKNVTLSPLGQSTIWLGSANTTSVAETLTVSSATGSIANAGNLSISGAASFQTGNGNITLNQAGNRFGTVRFIGNQVSISQVNDMNIVRGSAAIGAAQLASGSYITIAPEGSGIVSFGNTVVMTASGNITLPKLVQAVGTLTVNAAGTKDLSALSITSDLSGREPINLGTGAYLPPQP